MNGEGSLGKSVLQAGEGYLQPVDGANCTVEFCWQPHGSEATASTRDFNTVVGYTENHLVEVVHSILRLMKLGEIRALDPKEFSKSCGICGTLCDKGMDSKPSRPDEVPDDGNIAELLHSWLLESGQLSIRLAEFINPPRSWQLSSEEKLAQAEIMKEKGTELYQQKNICFAFKFYGKALKLLLCCDVKGFEDLELEKKSQHLKTLCYLNLALCQGSVNNHGHIIDNCSKALEVDAGNVKGYFRRAQAYCKLGKMDLAQQDLSTASQLEPGNKAVSRLLLQVNSVLRGQEEQLAQGMKKMFSA